MSFKSNSETYTNICISDLLFDEKVADMVEKHTATFPTKYFNNLCHMDTFPLTRSRLESVMKGYNDGLPPISVISTIGDKYVVHNGRHRVTATILNNHITIPCNIIE